MSFHCLKKEGRDEPNFLRADKHNIFYKSRVSILVCKIFAIFQERNEGWSWFFVQKHQPFLQVDTIISDGCIQAWLKYSKLKVLYNISAISPEEVRNGVDFLHAGKYQIFLQVYNILLDWFGQACPKFSEKFALS